MPTLTLYRRHITGRANQDENCKHAAKGRDYTRCDCPVWADGTLDGKRWHKSLKTTSWGTAEQRIASLATMTPEARHTLTVPLLPAAVALFLEERRSIWKEHSRQTYQSTLSQFAEYLGPRPVNGITDADIRNYLFSQQGRNGKPDPADNTTRHRIALLRCFFGQCKKKDWIKKNPAKAVPKPKVQELLTKPYTKEDLQRIFEFVDGPELTMHRAKETSATELRTAVYVLIYTGLRIIDLANLRRAAYNPHTGFLIVQAQKNSAKIRMKLPPVVVEALDQLPMTDSQFYFSGTETGRQGVADRLGQNLRVMGERIGVHVHPHRFRDTFAVSFLDKGGSMHALQKVLGHKSIQTTERHYAHESEEQWESVHRVVRSLDFTKYPDSGPFLVNPE